MLRAVAFQNFIYFREHQSLEFEDGPNFIVGPNASGKTAIFELIRRCLSNSANASTSSLADENLSAFVLCKFEIGEKISNKVRDEFPAEDVREVPAGCHVYSCLCMKANKETNTKEMYKLVCITNTDEQECHLEYYSSVGGNDPIPEPKSFTLPSPSTELLDTLKGLLNSKDSLKNLLRIMTEMKDKKESKIRGCEAILKALHNAVVVTFPIRSPGPMQWSHNPNIGKEEKHYITASDKADILQALLDSKDVDEEKSNKIFETIIDPLEYQFEKESGSTITVNGGKESLPTIKVKDGVQDIRFLKVPDGIIEAKQFSLMYAHKKYQTLLLEEPARGMHPHMIQKFRDLVFRTPTKEDQRKVLLITTHQTTMVNQWSMSRMFICRRTNNTEDVMNHCVVSLKQIERLYQFEDFVKEMVLSEAVLFVEGFTDKKVIRSVFDRVLEATGLTGKDGLTKTELTDFQQMAARTQIIYIGGTGVQEKIKTLQEVSDVLKSTCVFLFDKDKDKKCKCLAELQPEESDEKNNCLEQLQEKNRNTIIENLKIVHPKDWNKIMKCLEEPQQKNYKNKRKWKNRASFCARTLFKTPNSKENNEDEEEKNCKDVMKTRLTTGKLVWKELGFEETRTKVETPKVVSFISRILLPLLEETEGGRPDSKKKAEDSEPLPKEKGEKAEDSEALSNVKAEDSEPLSEEKAEDSKALSKEKAGNSKALSKEKAGNSKALSKEKAKDSEPLSKAKAEDTEALSKKTAEENEHLSKEKEEGEPRSKEKAEDNKALSKEKAEDTKAISREKAEECESLSKKKAEESKDLSEGNHFHWKSGNLEDVICRSLLKSNEDLLQEMFKCKHHGSQDKNAVKEKIKEMDIKTAHTLSTCLLKNGEMKDLLEFLVKIQKIDPNNK